MNKETKKLLVDIQKNNIFLMGKIFEILVFGKSNWKKDKYEYNSYLYCLKEIVRRGESEGTIYTDILKNRLAEVLNIDESRVKFYSSINTPMDQYHNTDGIILILTEKGFAKKITLDLTLLQKKDVFNADILIGFRYFCYLEHLVYKISEFVNKGSETINFKELKR